MFNYGPVSFSSNTLLHRVSFQSADTAIIWYLHLTTRAHRISTDDSNIRTVMVSAMGKDGGKSLKA